MHFDLPSVIAFVAALAISFALTPVARAVALKYGIIDHPSTAVKTHDVSTPYLGGLPIFLGACLTGAVLLFMGVIPYCPELVGLAIGGAVVVLIGLLDDIRGLSAPVRLTGHIVVSVFAVFMGVKLELPFLAQLGLPAFGVYAIEFFLSVITLVGLINAINIIDILDGFAAGIAVFAALTLSIMAAIAEMNPIVIYVGLALAGAAMGFLRWNYHPAKIFMGDTGSTYLGFMLGGIGMLYTQNHPNPIAVFTPLVVLAIPIFDTLYVMYLRSRKKMPIMAGSKDHFALRLVILGIDKKEAVDYIFVLAVCLSLTSIVMQQLDTPYYLLMLLCVLFAMVTFGHILWRAVNVPAEDESGGGADEAGS